MTTKTQPPRLASLTERISAAFGRQPSLSEARIRVDELEGKLEALKTSLSEAVAAKEAALYAAAVGVEGAAAERSRAQRDVLQLRDEIRDEKRLLELATDRLGAAMYADAQQKADGVWREASAALAARLEVARRVDDAIENLKAQILELETHSAKALGLLGGDAALNLSIPTVRATVAMWLKNAMGLPFPIDKPKTIAATVADQNVSAERHRPIAKIPTANPTAGDSE